MIGEIEKWFYIFFDAVPLYSKIEIDRVSRFLGVSRFYGRIRSPVWAAVKRNNSPERIKTFRMPRDSDCKTNTFRNLTPCFLFRNQNKGSEVVNLPIRR